MITVSSFDLVFDVFIMAINDVVSWVILPTWAGVFKKSTPNKDENY